MSMEHGSLGAWGGAMARRWVADCQSDCCSDSVTTGSSTVSRWYQVIDAPNLLPCRRTGAEQVETCLAQVRPWVVDITTDVLIDDVSTVKGDVGKRSNHTNTISYRGLFEGQDPQPSDTAGYIMMESNLVFLGDDS
jgi:hypothetical protein